MKTLRKLSLRTQILVILIIMVISLPVLFFIFYRKTESLIIQQNMDHLTNTTNILHRDLSDTYAQVSNVMVYAGYDNSVTKFMEAQEEMDYYKASASIASLFLLLENTQKGIYDMAVTNAKGRSMSMVGIQAGLAPSCLAYADGKVHYDGMAKIAIQNVEKNVFSFSMNVFSTGTSKPFHQRTGYMTLLLDAGFASKATSSYGELLNTNIFIVEGGGNILPVADPSGLSLSQPDLDNLASAGKSQGIIRLQGKKYLLQSRPVAEIQGHILTLTSYQELLKDVTRFRNLAFLIFFLLLAVVTSLYLAITQNFIQPLKKLMNFMVSLNGGNLKQLENRVDLKGYQEIEVISDEFNKMLHQVNSLRSQLFTTTTALFEKEIQEQKTVNINLQNQIKPHFLFNTLDTIKGLALAQGNQDIYKISTAFSSIFRYNLEEKKLATLGEELKCLDNYMAIIFLRFAGRISYQADCPCRLLSQPIPKSILLPLAEQGITTRLESMVEGGLLSLKAMEEGGELVISMADNGPPIPFEDLAALQSRLENGQYQSADALSPYWELEQANLRIKTIYGSCYGLWAGPGEEGGSQLTIRLPMAQAQEEAANTSQQRR